MDLLWFIWAVMGTQVAPVFAEWTSYECLFTPRAAKALFFPCVFNKIHNLTHLKSVCYCLPISICAPYLHPKPSLRPSNRVQHTHEHLLPTYRLHFHLFSETIFVKMFFLSHFSLKMFVLLWFIFVILVYIYISFCMFLSLVSPFCFPSLNNRPHLASNTAKRQRASC